jgi:hypothetical protein
VPAAPDQRRARRQQERHVERRPRDAERAAASGLAAIVEIMGVQS